MSSWPSQRRASCRPPVRRPFGEDPEFRFNGVAPAEPGKPERVGFHASAATQRAQFKMTRELLGEIGKVRCPRRRMCGSRLMRKPCAPRRRSR